MRVAVVALVAALCFACIDAYTTKTLDVVTKIRSRFAETIVSSRVYNEKDRASELKFECVLPKDAYITSFSMTIDGKEYDGMIEERQKAERTYERLKKKGKTTGIVRNRDESIQNFKTSVNVGSKQTVTFKLTYVELLMRHHGKYTNRLILLGSQFINKLTINIFICEAAPINNVTALPFITSSGANVAANSTIKQEGNYAHIILHPNVTASTSSLYNNGGSFTIEYQLDSPPNGNIVVDKNYFIHFFDPNALPDAAPLIADNVRRIMFVLDTSGSMSGKKLRQLKEAMHFVLNNLESTDIISIMDFDHKRVVWEENRRVFHEVNATVLQHGHEFIDNMSDDGGTEITLALEMALDLFKTEIATANERDISNFIVFVTDGWDSAESFVERLKKHNHGVQVNAVGIGNGVNAKLLKALAAVSGGSWTQIFEDANVVLQLQDFMLNLQSYENNLDVETKYPDIVDTIQMINKEKMLPGGEVVAIGNFRTAGLEKHKNASITVRLARKKTSVLNFSLDDPQPTCASVGNERLKRFLWQAYGILETKEALRKMEEEATYTEDGEWKNKSITLSMKYKLVTPVTAMIVAKPEDIEELKKEDEESKNQDKKDDIMQEVDDEINKLEVQEAAPQNNKPWWSGSGDPHFVVNLSKQVTACFNWHGENGEVYNILTDEDNGLVVNGELQTAAQYHGTFFNKIVVWTTKHQYAVIVTPSSITVRNMLEKNPHRSDFSFPVNNCDPYERTIDQVGLSLFNITKSYSILTVTISETLSLTIDIHFSTKNNKTAHLDFVESDTLALGSHLGGIFGAFPKMNQIKRRNARIHTGKDKTYLTYKGRKIIVEEREMWIPLQKSKVQCWFVKKAQYILGHPFSYFRVDRIFGLPHYTMI